MGHSLPLMMDLRENGFPGPADISRTLILRSLKSSSLLLNLRSHSLVMIGSVQHVHFLPDGSADDGECCDRRQQVQGGQYPRQELHKREGGTAPRPIGEERSATLRSSTRPRAARA